MAILPLGNREKKGQSSIVPAIEKIPIASVRVPAKRKKTLEENKVMSLAEDMLENGQKIPIRVREDTSGYVLIEGFHRLEALRALGEESIECYVVKARLH